MGRKGGHGGRVDAFRGADVWRLARAQHGVVTRVQLLERGLSRDAIGHRLSTGRLHAVHRGVYAVGRPELTRPGRWMAAVLRCGPHALLSHTSAAALWEIEDRERTIEVSVPQPAHPRSGAGLRVHRRRLPASDASVRDGIPLTSPARTLTDLAAFASRPRLEAAVNAADKLDLIDPEQLRAHLARRAGQPGAPALRALLDGATFRLTDSELERRFLRLVRRTGLPLPETGVRLNGYTVDFLWRDLGLVVETDGLRYHRTPQQQGRDRRRDQALLATGLTTLRFTHSQVAHEPVQVAATLRTVAGDSGSPRLPGRD